MTVSDGIDCERAPNTHAHSIPSTTRRRRQSRWMAFAYLLSPASQCCSSQRSPLPAPAATSTIRHTAWGLDASELLTKESAEGVTNLHYVLVCISAAHFQHKKPTKIYLRFYLLFCITLSNESSSCITNYRYFWKFKLDRSMYVVRSYPLKNAKQANISKVNNQN